MKYTLSKKERLSSGKRIEQLFSSGQTFNVYPIRVIYFLGHTESPGIQVLFSVPKKRFKKAVDRNRIKRLLREAYRLQKHGLLEKTNSYSLCLHIGLIYTGSLPDIPYEEIGTAMQQILDRLIKITADTPTVSPFECSL
jgi:ribonuclease P protein component